MWRLVEQLVEKLRRGRSVRGAGSVRATRLGIETLENRTVLSANFGVDYEALTYHHFSETPPRIFVDHETAVALAAAFAEDAPVGFAEDRTPTEFAEDASFVMIIGFRLDHRAMDNGWGSGKPPLGLTWGGDRPPANFAASSPEDGSVGSSGLGDKGPLRIQTPVSSNVDSGNNHDALTNNFDPPPPDLEMLLERIVESQHVATSPFMSPVSSSTTNDGAETVDSASLLATYATLAASIDDDDSSVTNHDAAFDGYSTLRDGESEREEYLQLLAEDQTRDAAAAEAGGFVDLDEARIDGADDLSNVAADDQREAIESALRSLAARRGDARATLLPENWLEQTWLPADVAQKGEANANQIADEPGGMILLQPMADDAGDELIAAADMSEVIETAVEMEATIGAFQAFDVSIDEAPAAVAKPAPAHELGAKQDRDASPSDGTTDRQAASGLGVLAAGAMALAAKRQIDDRRRKPR